MDAALRLFAEGGFVATTVEQIAAVLGDRPPHEAAASAVRNALLEVAANYAAERERLLLRARLTPQNPSVLARSLALQNQWEEVVAGAVADRLRVDVATDPRPRLLAAVTLSAMRVAQRRWIETGDATHLPTLLVDHLDLLERGLRALDGGGVPAAPAVPQRPPLRPTPKPTPRVPIALLTVEGRHLEVNPALCAFLGRSAGDLRGRMWLWWWIARCRCRRAWSRSDPTAS